MFTIKWVVKTSNGEITRMYTAEKVTVAYRDASSPITNTSLPAYSPWEVGGRPVEASLVIIDDWHLKGSSFDCGTIYVMNDHGSTVGKYLLDQTPREEPMELFMVS